MLVSLPHLTMLEATPPEVVRAAAAAGFSAVCLRLFPTMPGERQHPMIGNTPMMRETLRLLADTGLKVLDIEAVWVNPDTLADDYVSGFEAAGRLGARVIQAIANDDDEARLTDTYAALSEAAAPFGLTVDLEFMAGARVKSLARCRRVAEASGAPNAGLMIDCLHVNRCHVQLDELTQTPSRLLHMLQLCDGPAIAPEGQAAMEEARFNRRLPGEGDFDLLGIWRAMPPDIDVSIEAPFGMLAEQLSLADRALALKQSADRFFARAGVPGGSRNDA